MAEEIRIGRIDLSFHKASAIEVAKVVEKNMDIQSASYSRDTKQHLRC